jgi:hypothetical protein
MPAVDHTHLPSLRQLSRWVLGLLLAVAVAASSFFAWRVVGLMRMAQESEERAAPALATKVRAVANVEQLQVLGEQLVNAPAREGWQAAGAAMQALAFHPSMATLPDPTGVVNESFAVAERLMRLRETGIDPTLAAEIWRAHLEKLNAVSDDGAVQMVALSTDMAKATRQAATTCSTCCWRGQYWPCRRCSCCCTWSNARRSTLSRPWHAGWGICTLARLTLCPCPQSS